MAYLSERGPGIARIGDIRGDMIATIALSMAANIIVGATLTAGEISDAESLAIEMTSMAAPNFVEVTTSTAVIADSKVAKHSMAESRTVGASTAVDHMEAATAEATGKISP